jgi:amino acid transporter
MNFLARRSLIWVTLNFVGMLAFLRLAAEIWVLPGEQGLPGGPGDPFYWFFILIPFQLIFLTVNLLVLYVIIKRRSEPSVKKRICLWMIVAILWVIVVLYDHHRSVREITFVASLMPLAILHA